MISVTAAGRACLALALSIGLPSVATAQQPGNMDGLLETFQLKAKLAPASPFVSASRPARDAGFIPVGIPHPERGIKVMSAAELAATEADLDASRERQQRRAGRRPPAVPLKVAKPAANATVP